MKSAFISLIGRPNCGKSSLLNTVLGEQISIVTPLPQTTRRNIKGIYNEADLQLVFLDTPGVHAGGHALNKAMIDQCRAALAKDEADVVCYLVDLSRDWGAEEEMAAALAQESGLPVLVVFNKKDAVDSPEQKVREFLTRFPRLDPFPRVILSAIHPSAKKDFLSALLPLVPEGPAHFPPDELTDENMRFFAAEYLRKYLILNTRQEVPHAAFVEITAYKEEPTGHKISANIHVETDGQKGIVIGKGGTIIAKIRREAERDLRKLAGVPVSIQTHIIVTPKWRDNEAFLRDAGYGR